MKDLNGKSFKPEKFKFSLVDISKAVLANFGLAESKIKLPEHSKLVLFLLDGLGYRNLENWGLLDLLPGEKVEVQSTYPSTTTTALTTLATALEPSMHGIIDYAFFSPEHADVVYPMNGITLHGLQADVSAILPNVPTIFELLSSFEVKAYYLTNTAYADTEFGKFLGKGAKVIGYESFGDLEVELKKLLRKREESFTAVYMSQPDGMLHENKGKQAVKAELKYVLGLIDELKHVKGSEEVLVLIVSDHGHIMVKKNDIKLMEELNLLLNYPAFGSFQRFLHLFPRRGKEEDVISLFENTNFFVFDALEFALKFMGREISELTYERLPDFFLVAKERETIATSENQVKAGGRHGGASRLELSALLAYFGLDEF